MESTIQFITALWVLRKAYGSVITRSVDQLFKIFAKRGFLINYSCTILAVSR